MKKKAVIWLCAGALACSVLAGCGAQQTVDSNASAGVSAEASSAVESSAAQSSTAVVSDEEAAAHVADLIDQIYVQNWTEDTDALCAEARAAWDALTDAQKEMVEGEEADPDYFGRDTGDASKDDPLNQDNIGENEILVVSFGTSFNDSRVADISSVEKAIQKANPDWSVRRAFTAQIIINHVQARDNEKIDNMKQALDRAVANGVKNLVVQPTHLMHGAEYDELVEELEKYQDKFASVIVAEPLLGPVGTDATVINEDKAAVAKAISEQAVKTAGYASMEDAEKDSVAFVFMGHGTSHNAKVTYSQMQTQMATLGYKNVFIGTVEGEPEDTACEAVIDKVAEAGYKKIVLRPLMVVAGDHANNDMAGEEEDSWISLFKASGHFDQVDTQIAGLGEIAAVQEIYVAHTAAAIKEAPEAASAAGSATAVTELADGVYEAKFTTDSSMFKVNEAKDGKGTLTVKDGKMTIHVTLSSKKILNLYAGLAADAQKSGAVLLQPTTDTVKYSDGLTDEAYGFDIPVPAIGKEFDVALVGEKGTWYDHKVSVSEPVKAE
ncbi:MAG: sirohydrochlorin cobaltochelatase [Lachnospiraceae bacterium]|nr:sirohydrochlorin cobaltochelatase [Lachnospiraceae bacterium]